MNLESLEARLLQLREQKNLVANCTYSASASLGRVVHGTEWIQVKKVC